MEYSIYHGLFQLYFGTYLYCEILEYYTPFSILDMQKSDNLGYLLDIFEYSKNRGPTKDGKSGIFRIFGIFRDIPLFNFGT